MSIPEESVKDSKSQQAVKQLQRNSDGQETSRDVPSTYAVDQQSTPVMSLVESTRSRRKRRISSRLNDYVVNNV